MLNRSCIPDVSRQDTLLVVLSAAPFVGPAATESLPAGDKEKTKLGLVNRSKVLYDIVLLRNFRLFSVEAKMFLSRHQQNKPDNGRHAVFPQGILGGGVRRGRNDLIPGCLRRRTCVDSPVAGSGSHSRRRERTPTILHTKPLKPQLSGHERPTRQSGKRACS